ncbi:T9SS type A sorting domain-containing protein [Hymenobacter sp. B81]|uniref:T9SS type A sorting domain-containing protein n=1 Tax=Hymenobacter sp. B81 TaxID=3344878 RepID=UPI0037DC05B0
MPTKRTLGLLLFLAAPGLSRAQVVHPLGAATWPVGWESPRLAPASLTAAARLDLDADGVDDVVFSNDIFVPPGPGTSTRTFRLARLHPGFEIACDSFEFDSAERFQAGQLIAGGLSWQSGGYLDYEVTGSGGTGGRGFFRDGVPGFVVARAAVAGRWRYWWIQVEPRFRTAAGEVRRVNYFGSSSGTVLAARPRGASPVLAEAYPNPSADSWQLRTDYRGPYYLFDALGRVRSQGQVTGRETVVPGNLLPAGLYHLRLGSGAVPSTTLLKQ